MSEANSGGAVGLRSLPRRQVVITLAGTLLAMFLASLDQTVVGTAMPRIIADLGGFSQYTWVTTAYLVTSTVILPITGKITDMYGRKPFYVSGIAVFVVGSLLTGLSQTMTQIIVCRGLQGIGAGIIMANTFTVVADLFPPAERGKYQGLMSGVWGISAVIGPTLGGLVTDTLSWHWIFFINVPLGVITIIAFILFFPNFRADHHRHVIDYPGITCLVLAVVPLLLALSWGGVEFPWDSAPVITAFVVAAAAVALFPFIEARSAEPIIPLHIFRNPVVAVSVPILFFSGFVMFGSIIFVPLYFQGVLGLSATTSGGFLTPMTLGQVVGSSVSGQVLSRTGGHYRLQGFFGLGLMMMGLWLLSRMGTSTGYASAVVNIIMVGVGLGIVMPIYTIAVQNAVPYNVLGAATATVPFLRSLGGAAGLAAFGAVVTNRFASEFLAELPAAAKAAIPPQLISSVTSDAQVLVSPQAQAQLQATFNGMGPQGAALYEQTIHVMREALNSGVTEVFLLASIITAVILVINFFLREVPLRKQHTDTTIPRQAEKK